MGLRSGFDLAPPDLEVLGGEAFDSDVAVYIGPDSPVKALLDARGPAYTEIILPESVSLSVDGTVPLEGEAAVQIAVEPEGADAEHLLWSSSDPTVAEVSADGMVRGLSEGRDTMTYISYSTRKKWTDKYIKGDVIVILETCCAASAFSPGADPRSARMSTPTISTRNAGPQIPITSFSPPSNPGGHRRRRPGQRIRA